MSKLNCIEIETDSSDRTRLIKDFLSLPKRLYRKDRNMEDASTVRKLLKGEHPLSGYFRLTPFVTYDDKRVVGRFAITAYENDETAYIGFFECINDTSVSGIMFETAYNYCRDRGYTSITGPVDASFWIKYRLKINRFDVAPYTGEPYNREYYPDLFKDAGYEIVQHYTSNEYRTIDETYVNEKYESRFREFAEKGYRIVSPEREDYDKAIDEVYRMISELYRDFPVFKDVSHDDFVRVFSSYKTIMNMSMTKMAYLGDKAVGFYVSIPDYGNIVYHLNPVNIMRILRLREKPQRYVMLYMGVDSAHTGLGKAMVYSIMKELKQSGLPSIGALARDGKVTQNYAHEEITDVYEYVLLERKITDVR